MCAGLARLLLVPSDSWSSIIEPRFAHASSGVGGSSIHNLSTLQALEVGDILPDMQLLTDEGESVRLLVRYHGPDFFAGQAPLRSSCECCLISCMFHPRKMPSITLCGSEGEGSAEPAYLKLPAPTLRCLPYRQPGTRVVPRSSMYRISSERKARLYLLIQRLIQQDVPSRRQDSEITMLT